MGSRTSIQDQFGVAEIFGDRFGVAKRKGLGTAGLGTSCCHHQKQISPIYFPLYGLILEIPVTEKFVRCGLGSGGTILFTKW